MQQQRVGEDMQQQADEYYTEQPQQEWRNSDWKFEGNESNGISQSNKYMNALTPMNPINLCSNKPQVGHTKYGYAASSILRAVSLTSENLTNWAILDSGASSHLLSTAPLMNKKVADRPLQVKLPNGNIIHSSHIAELDLPLLPVAGREIHILPGLASHSLVSVIKLCNAGCQVDVKYISCEIRYRGKTIVQCSKDVNTGIWMMPLTSRIKAPTYKIRRNGEGQIVDERKISTTSEAGWANFTRQYKKVQNDQYDGTTINEP